MKSFKSIGCSYIKGQGWVFFVENDMDRARSDNFPDLINQAVQIDGNVYLCHGVESFCVERQYKGMTIGLLCNYQMGVDAHDCSDAIRRPNTSIQGIKDRGIDVNHNPLYDILPDDGV